MNPMDHYPADPVNPVKNSLRHTKKLIVSGTDWTRTSLNDFLFYPCFIRVQSVALFTPFFRKCRTR